LEDLDVFGLMMDEEGKMGADGVAMNANRMAAARIERRALDREHFLSRFITDNEEAKKCVAIIQGSPSNTLRIELKKAECRARHAGEQALLAEERRLLDGTMTREAFAERIKQVSNPTQ
jgi:hypothetical protein